MLSNILGLVWSLYSYHRSRNQELQITMSFLCFSLNFFWKRDRKDTLLLFSSFLGEIHILSQLPSLRPQELYPCIARDDAYGLASALLTPNGQGKELNVKFYAEN